RRHCDGLRPHRAGRAHRPGARVPRHGAARRDRRGPDRARRPREPGPAEDLHVTTTDLLRCTSCGRALLAGEAFCEAGGARGELAVPDYSALDLGVAAVVSDRGLVHAHNEDAFALISVRDGLAVVVCDGVSASVAADLAARTAATAVADAL